MPNNWLVLVIFVVHFILFFRLSLVRKTSPYILATISFCMLSIYSALRLWAPEMMFFNRHGYTYFRVMAWVATCMALAAYIWNKAKRLTHKR